MTPAQLLAILKARRRIALSVFGLCVVVAVVLSLVLPKQYTATASVVVDPRPDPVAGMAGGLMPSLAFIATQVDVIGSDRVAFRVIRNLKLADNPAIRQEFEDDADGQGSIEVWLANLFHKRLDVRPSRESNVIQVSYTAQDPRFAAGIANAFVQAYLETVLELRVDPARQYVGFFDTRSKEARAALEKAQAQLSAYQQKKGLIATDERLDVENARLNELSSQVVLLQALSAESSSRATQAQGGAGERMQEVLNNSLIASLKADAARAEARLRELGARYGDKHPQLVEARANLGELRSRIAAETARVTAGVTVTNTINRSRESQVRAELEQQREKVLRMKAVRDEGQVLVREVENAQRSYDALLARLNQTSLESQTTQSNANVLTQAVAPNEHSSPRLALNTALAVCVGLMLALLTAVGLEFIDRRVRAPEDAGWAVEAPLLGVMPRPLVTPRLIAFGPTVGDRVLHRLTTQRKGT
ncbi:chain length determinant protein EpsF [Aquabacterium humicola]|uniref:chain length determinant protein EpsF n=1 Tax=Aquabacterium humicola TaxID=3237377 RepID=UPI0025431BC5|nr:chain length determinant protein EpsF [Rubrivivax pictus]